MFTVGPSNEKVINKILFTLLVNLANHIEQLHDDFLPAGLRTFVVEYLQTCDLFAATGNRMLAQFGHPYKYMNGYGNKKLSEIPGPINSVINILQEKFSLEKNLRPNSIVIEKYHGINERQPLQSYNEPTIARDSHIYTLSLGDSCTISFLDKCTGNVSEICISDNSIFNMSVKSIYCPLL